MLEDLPVQTKLREEEVVVQQIIVNDEIQSITAKTQSLCCSACNKSLFTFQANTKYEEAYKQVLAQKENLQSKLSICPGCGRRLRYDFDVVDGEIINE